MMLVRGFAMGGLDGIGIVGWSAFVAALGIGCFAFAALRHLRRNFLGYLFSCGVAGAVTAGSLVGALFLVAADPYGGDAALIRYPLFWAFWLTCGGITGIVYGVIALGAQKPD